MDFQMTNEIKEAIEKHLPAQTSGVLRKILQEYEDNKEKIKRDEELKDRVIKLEKLEQEIEGTKALQKVTEDKLAEIAERERHVELEMARSRASTLQEVVDQQNKFVALLCGNMQFRESIWKTKNFQDQFGMTNCEADYEIERKVNYGHDDENAPRV